MAALKKTLLDQKYLAYPTITRRAAAQRAQRHGGRGRRALALQQRVDPRSGEVETIRVGRSPHGIFVHPRRAERN